MAKKNTILHINCNYMTTKLHQIMIQHLNGTNNIVFAPINRTATTVVKPDKYVTVSKCFNKYDRLLYYYKQHKIYKSLINSINDPKNIDCIHAYTLFTDGNIAYRLHKKYKIPYVVAIRDTDVNAFYKYRFYLKNRGTKILNNASKVFFLSKSYETQVINKYVPKKYRKEVLIKSMVVPNGIDDFWLENINYTKKITSVTKRLKNKQVKLLFVGQIIKRKNIGLILKTINRLNKLGWNVSFDVVGKINDYALFTELQKNKHFNYLGEKTKEDLIKCYRNHDIFIMPSKTETFGLVYVEAMSQGLPVIYSKNQGFDNQFPNGAVGISVNNKSEDDCVNGIIKITENYENMYNNCINGAKKYRWDVICKRYVSVYNDIIK